MRRISFAATQMACSKDTENNILNAEKIVRKAKKMGADVVLLQELFSNLYFMQEYDLKNFDLACEEESSPLLVRMSALAKELEVVLPVNFFEKAGKVFYNSVVVFDVDGKKLGKYRKTHIPDDPGYYEKYYFSPGDTGFKVFSSKLCKIGIGICWDQWFPEAARCMCLQGAEVLMYPTAIGTAAVRFDQLKTQVIDKGVQGYMHWRNAMIGHSAANMVPVLASNRIGDEYVGDTAIKFYGASFITDELGNLKEEADTSTETILLHTFDLDSLAEKRREGLFFRDRRPDKYKTLFTLDGENSAL